MTFLFFLSNQFYNILCNFNVIPQTLLMANYIVKEISPQCLPSNTSTQIQTKGQIFIYSPTVHGPILSVVYQKWINLLFTPPNCYSYYMRDKLSQIQRQIRSHQKQQYFQRRREQLYENYCQPLPSFPNSASYRNSPYFIHNGYPLSLASRPQQMEEENPLSRSSKQTEHLKFKFTVNCLEDGQYYLNQFMDQLNQRYLQEMMFLLGRLLDKISRLQLQMSAYQDISKSQLVYMILKTINNFLAIDSPHNSLRVQNSKYARLLLQNLLQQSCATLLKTEDTVIVSALINISYELGVKYIIPPNYSLIKYILVRIITKESLFNGAGSDMSVEMSRRIETLLMKYLGGVSLEQSCNNKMKNVHHLQIVFEYYNFIEFNLTNAYQFAKNQEHPFDYEHLNNNLSFSLNLLTQIVKKFKVKMLSQRQNLQSLLLLVRPTIVDLVVGLTVIHQDNEYEGDYKDEFMTVVEETGSVMLNYLREIKNKYLGQRNGLLKLVDMDEWGLNGCKYPLAQLLFLVKVHVRQLQQLLD